MDLVTVVFYHLTVFSYRRSAKGLFLDTLSAQKQKKDFYLNQSGHAMSRATLYHHFIDFFAVTKATWSKHSSFFRTLYRGHMMSVKTETIQKSYRILRNLFSFLKLYILNFFFHLHFSCFGISGTFETWK